VAIRKNLDRRVQLANLGPDFASSIVTDIGRPRANKEVTYEKERSHLYRHAVTSNGELGKLLPARVAAYVQEKAAICQPKDIYVCNGTIEENQRLLHLMQQEGMVKPLKKYENW
uniref:Phosphoenolpyruvate carboxykinase GTP-utilising N-terminal domain-containing protein n=1 Tax=Plectus sambesii TaxID=2011161 RepID=A0A914UUI1_9BILA